MILDTTTKSLELILGAAAATNAMPVVVDYVDMTTTTTLSGSSDTQSNGTTVVTILAAPAASTQRKVNSISVYNADTVSSTVTIRLNNNTTLRNLISVTLQVGDTIGFTDVNGWYLLDSNGNLKSVQAASATAIATAIHAATDKTTPVGADELGIWDSITGLLNKVSFTNLWAQVNGGYPSIASAATIDVFGAAGTVVGVSGTTTVTALTAAPRAGVKKTVIPSDAAGFSITASANLVVDGATSGTYLMPKDANLEFISTSTTTFKVTTIFAGGTFTPVVAGTITAGTGTYTTQVGRWTKIGNLISYRIDLVWTAHTGTGNIVINGLPFTSANTNTPPASVTVSNLAMTAGNVAGGSVAPNSTQFQSLQMPTGGGTYNLIPMDTAASMFVSGQYAVS